MKTWQLQETKAHFSEVVRQANQSGPQQITLHGEPSVVILSQKEYEKLTEPPLSFVEFIRQSPLVGAKIKIHRDDSLTRDIDL